MVRGLSAGGPGGVKQASEDEGTGYLGADGREAAPDQPGDDRSAVEPKKGKIKDPRRYGSRGADLIAKKIPLRMTDWETGRVGYVDTDLVLHCGVSMDGSMGIIFPPWRSPRVGGRGKL